MKRIIIITTSALLILWLGCSQQTIKPFSLSISPAFKLIPKTEYNLQDYPELNALVEKSPLKDKVIQSLKDAQGNWGSLAEAIIHIKEPVPHEDLLWLITELSHLDRLETTPVMLEEHIRYAHLVKDKFIPQMDHELFRKYILFPLISKREHLGTWRKEVYLFFLPLIKPDLTETVTVLNQWVAANIKERAEDMLGPGMTPLMVLRSRHGTASEATLLTAGVLRALGIPARLVQDDGDWLEFYEGKEWVPLYPMKPESLGKKTAPEAAVHYKTPGIFKICLMRKGLSVNDPECLTLSQYKDGVWLPQDELPAEFKDERFVIQAPAGTYLVQAGTRNKNGDTYFFAREMAIKEGQEVNLTINLDIPFKELEEEDRMVRKIEPLPDFSAKDLKGNEVKFSGLRQDRILLVVFFSLASEPSVRMMPMIARVLPALEKQGGKLVGVYVGNKELEKLPDYLKINTLDFPVLLDTTGDIANLFKLPYSKETASYTNLPSLILVSKDGKINYWDEGYNLNIESCLKETIELLK